MEAKKKNLVIAGVVAAALSLAAGTVAAQDYFFPLFGAYVDHVVPGDSPCGETPIRTITPSTYEETVMLWYLCEDNRVIARRFFRAGGGAQVPQPVYLVNPPDSRPRPARLRPRRRPRRRAARRTRDSSPASAAAACLRIIRSHRVGRLSFARACPRARDAPLPRRANARHPSGCRAFSFCGTLSFGQTSGGS